MKALKVILVIVFVIIALGVATYAYYGGFTKVKFNIEKTGGEVVAYEDLIGDYSQAGEITDRVYKVLLDDCSIATTKGIGMYFDNPEVVEKDKLRSQVGCILDNPDSVMIAKAATKFKIETCPEGSYIVTEFPFKGTASVIVGMMKVYPALKEYIKLNGCSEEGAISEIYDVSNKKIVYRQLIVADEPLVEADIDEAQPAGQSE